MYVDLFIRAQALAENPPIYPQELILKILELTYDGRIQDFDSEYLSDGCEFDL